MLFNLFLFQCKICGEVVKLRGKGKTWTHEFTKHLASHAKQTGDTFKCQQCDFVRTNFMKRKYLFDVKCHPLYLQATAWEYNLKRHVKEAHGDESHMVECPTCGKKISG